MASNLRRHMDAAKFESRLLGDIERMLLAAGPDEDRDMSFMHPGDICKSDWCPRQSFYFMTKTKPDKAETKPSRILEGIWEQGHDAHRKYQRWIDDLGRLRGAWLCAACEAYFEATSPRMCPSCGAGRLALIYKEVVFFNEEHSILGHADGDIDEGHSDMADDPLVEIKTVAEGTIRLEQPKLLIEHTHKVLVNGKQTSFVDLRGLWRSFRRPFPTHLRQGTLYGVLMGRKEIIFIYEFKPTGVTKEFVIRVQPSIVEDILDQALDVKWAVSKNRAPGRPSFADGPDAKVCKDCVFRGTCWSLVAPAIGEQGDGAQAEEGHRVRVIQGSAGGRAPVGGRRSGLAGAATRGSSDPQHPASGLRRRQPDQHDGAVHGVARLPVGPTVDGGNRRTVRRIRRLPR